MNWRRFVRDVRSDLEGCGYATEFDDSGRKHPRLYIRCPTDPPDKRVFVCVSSTARYDHPHVFRRKMNDIKNELVKIGTPVKEGKVNTNSMAKSIVTGVQQMNPNHPSLRQEQRQENKPEAKPEETRPGQQPPAPLAVKTEEPPRRYQVRAYLKGKNLSISLDRSVVDEFPEHARRVRLFLTSDKKLVMAFSNKGVEMGNTAGVHVAGWRSRL